MTETIVSTIAPAPQKRSPGSANHGSVKPPAPAKHFKSLLTEMMGSPAKPAANATAGSPDAGQQAPAASTNESATPGQDFSAALTELMGLPEEAASPAPIQGTAAVEVGTFGPGTPGLVPAIVSQESEASEGEEPEEAEEAEGEEPTEAKGKEAPLVLVPVDVESQIAIQGRESREQSQPGTPRQSPPAGETSLRPVAATHLAWNEAELPAATKLEMEKAWADVRKFEFTEEREAPRVAQPLLAQAAPADAAQKQAMITTDPMINLRQEKLPARIGFVTNGGIETRLPERSKSEPGIPGNTASTGSSFSDFIRTFDHVEQAKPAQPVEMPDLPQLKVVRSVSMEVGDADQQVTIRIQERGGDLSLQLNAANEPLRRELQSSVSQLMNALKHEEVKVSNIEVTRRAPVDRVRRLKEAR